MREHEYDPYNNTPAPPRQAPRSLTGNGLVAGGIALNVAAALTVAADTFATRAGGDLLSGDEWALATLAGPIGMGVCIWGAVKVRSAERTRTPGTGTRSGQAGE